jgi:hypothetical protein
MSDIKAAPKKPSLWDKIVSWGRDRALHLPAESNSLDDLIAKAMPALQRAATRVAIQAAVEQAVGNGAGMFWVIRRTVIAGVERALGGSVPQEVRKGIEGALDRALETGVSQGAGALNGAITRELNKVLQIEP